MWPPVAGQSSASPKYQFQPQPDLQVHRFKLPSNSIVTKVVDTTPCVALIRAVFLQSQVRGGGVRQVTVAKGHGEGGPRLEIKSWPHVGVCCPYAYAPSCFLVFWGLQALCPIHTNAAALLLLLLLPCAVLFQYFVLLVPCRSFASICSIRNNHWLQFGHSQSHLLLTLLPQRAGGWPIPYVMVPVHYGASWRATK